MNIMRGVWVIRYILIRRQKGARTIKLRYSEYKNILEVPAYVGNVYTRNAYFILNIRRMAKRVYKLKNKNGI